MISIAKIMENPRLALALLRKFWLLVLVAVLIGGGIAFAYNMLVTPRYTSKISLLIWNRDIDKITSASGRAVAGKKDSTINEVNDVIRYNSLVSASLHVANRLTPAFKKLINSLVVKEATDKKLLERGFKEPFTYKIKCKVIMSSCVMDLSVTSTDSKLSTAAANALTECFSKEQQRLMNVKYIQAIAPASIPKSPSWPLKKLVLFLGMFGGLVAGCTLAFCIEQTDVTVKNSEDIKDLDLLTLGLLPQVSDVETLFHQKKFENKGNLHLIVDAVRVINTTIDFLRVDNPLKVISVTSALPNSGKTTNVILLAKAMGATNKRVLIIDCDLRKPKLRKNLSLDEGKGLVDFLISPDNAKPEAFIRKDILQGVDVMDNALIPPNPPELLGAERFRKMLDDLKDSYDCILLDCPPGLNMADAMVTGGIVDGIILIMEAGQTKIKEVQHLLEQFGALKGKILGTVLNKVKLNNSKYSYYSYYGHYGSKDFSSSKSR
jgi:capsular exopolysaccharide synthesis family protein